MEDKKKTKFIKGTFKQIKSGDILLDVYVQDLIDIANERGYARLVLRARKEVGQYGDTHFLYENTYRKNSTAGLPPEKEGQKTTFVTEKEGQKTTFVTEKEGQKTTFVKPKAKAAKANEAKHQSYQTDTTDELPF